MKRAYRLVLSASVVLGSLGSFGCSASTAGSDPASPAGEAQGSVATAAGATRIQAVAPNAKSGRVRLIADALSTVPLADDQRAQIETLASEAEARHAAGASVRADFMTALAAQVEAGRIDRGALQAKIDAGAEAMNASRPADQAALQRLHALLTPEQRGQLADALEARHKAMRAAHSHEGHQAHMAEWATDLKLTDAQQTEIAAMFASERAAHAADFKAMHERMGHDHGRSFAESFRSETLVLPAPEDAHVHANGMADHFVKMAEAIVPILTPEQRTLAATKLRERAAGGDEGPLAE